MATLFKDHSLQQRFNRQGYLVAPFLLQKQVDDLLDIYKQTINTNNVSGLYESSRNNDAVTNRLINDAIHDVMKESAEKIFSDARFYGGTFMVKSCRDSEMLPLHQDWSVVEEDRYSTLFLWCPLQDVSPTNGGIFLLEGSHDYFNNLRSGSYPSNRYILSTHHQQFVKNIYLKAGEAIIYSDKIFHGSYKNNGKEDRIVATARVMESNAPLVYFHKTGNDEVTVFEASSDFYLDNIDSIAKGNLPDTARRLYSRYYRHQEVTVDSLQRKMDEQYNGTKNNLPMECDLFIDPQQQEDFEKKGFVIIDLIVQTKVDKLYDFYSTIIKELSPGQGFHVSLDSDNPGQVKTVSEYLISTVQQDLEKYFKNYQVFTASYVIKEKNPMGFVPPHQDWTFVNENEYWSATIWCPLVNVSIENGALGVIHGSHLFYDHVRPSPSSSYEPPFKDAIDVIFPYLDIIDLKAGQAIVFNNKTIHGSPPNTLDQSRLAFGIGITHQNASILHYYMLPGKEKEFVEAYEVDPSFFHNYNNARLSGLYAQGEKPQELNSIGISRYTYINYEKSELVKKMEAAGNKINKHIEVPAMFQAKEEIQSEDNHSEIPLPSKLPFWKVYTPVNIFKEVRYRILKR